MGERSDENLDFERYESEYVKLRSILNKALRSMDAGESVLNKMLGLKIAEHAKNMAGVLKLMEGELTSKNPMNRIKYVAKHRVYKNEFENEILPNIVEKIDVHNKEANLNNGGQRQPETKPKPSRNIFTKFIRSSRTKFAFEPNSKPIDVNSTMDERQALLSTMDSLRISGIHLDNSLKTAMDSDKISAGIIQTLGMQRADLEGAQSRAQFSNKVIDESNRHIRNMNFRKNKDKFILLITAISLFLLTILILYYKLHARFSLK